MGSDPQYAKYPDLSLAQDIFTLTNISSTPVLRQKSLKKLQDAISEQKMAPLYRYLAHPTEGILNTSGEGTARSQPQSKKANGAPPTLIKRRSSIPVEFPWDDELYAKLKAENEEELRGFEKEETEAEEKAGETEVHAAKGKRAEFWARVCDQVSEKFAYGGNVGFCVKLTPSRTRPFPHMKPFSKRRVCWGTKLI